MPRLDSDEQSNMTKIIKRVALGIGAFIFLVIFFGSFGTIGAGERGVKTRFGAVVGVLPQGLYFKLPIIEGVTTMDIQTQKEQADADASSSDLQTVKATVAVNYNLVDDKVADLFTRIGQNYSTKVIDPAIQETVKAVTAKYTAEQLITQRPQVTDDIKKQLSTTLSQSDITVTAVSIVNFEFSAQFNQAIEAKVTAEQNALAAKNKLEQVKFEAEQRVATANAEAQAIKIQTEAINSQGGIGYVNLKAVEKWSGNLPQYMLPGAVLPFIGDVIKR